MTDNNVIDPVVGSLSDGVQGAWQLPLIPTKLTPPRRAGRVVTRDRLIGLQQSILKRALTLVQAPAGYGKSTLLSQWRQCFLIAGKVVAWVSLSEEDASAHRFLSYVTASLSAAHAGICEGARAMLLSGPSVPAQVAESVLITELEACGKDVVLILDDFHLISDTQVHNLLAHFLLNIPENIHLIVATRTELPLRLSELRLRDQVLNVGATDLRFDFGDLASFLGEVVNLKLPSSAVNRLFEITEGWIAGVQIASFSPRLKSDPQAFLDEFSSSSKDLQSYMTEGVMDLLPKEMSAFLVRCSILERFNPELCELIAGVEDGRAMLDQVESLNLFIFALDDEWQWYRFHRLFADYLRDRLRREHPEEIEKLHRAACAWFADQQLWAEAVRHALAVGENELAQAYLESCAMEMLAQSRAARLVNWGRQFSAADLRNNIDLSLAIAFAQLLMMDLERSQTLLNEIDKDLGRGPADAGRRMQLQTASALLAVLQDRLEEGKQMAEPLMIGKGTMRSGDLELVYNVLSYVYLSEERYEALDKLQRTALRGMGKTHFGYAYRKNFEGLAQFWQGRIDRAIYLFSDAFCFAERFAGRRSLMAISAAAFLAEVRYEQNDLDGADELLAAKMAGALDTCNLTAALSLFSVMSRLCYQRGTKDESWALLDEMEALAIKQKWQRLEARCYGLRIQIEVWQGDQSGAASILGCLEALVQHTDLDRISRNFIEEDLLIARARVKRIQGDDAELIEPLSERIDALEQRGTYYRSAKLRMLKALAQAGNGDAKAACDTLLAALILGQEQRLCRTFVDEVQGGRALLESTKGMLSSDQQQLMPYLDQLTASMGALYPDNKKQPPGRAPEPSDLEKIGGSEVTDREQEILSLIANGLYNKEVARVLSISEGTVKWHLKNLYSKLGVSSRTQALKQAQKLRLIS